MVSSKMKPVAVPRQYNNYVSSVRHWLASVRTNELKKRTCKIVKELAIWKQNNNYFIPTSNKNH